MYSHRLILENNLILKAIANRLGIDPEVYSLAGTKSSGKHLSVKVAELTKLGYSKNDIANMLGCHPSTVAYYRRQAKARAEIDAIDEELRGQDKVQFDDELIDIDDLDSGDIDLEDFEDEEDIPVFTPSVKKQ